VYLIKSMIQVMRFLVRILKTRTGFFLPPLINHEGTNKVKNGMLNIKKPELTGFKTKIVSHS
jgi:hypothetical protein